MAKKNEAVKWIICRFCLKQDEEIQVSSIFEAEEEDLLSSIRAFGEIQCNRNDKIPEAMCKKCLLLLNAAIRFRKICKRSEECFQELLKIPKNDETTQLITIKTEIVNDENTSTTNECSNDTEEINVIVDEEVQLVMEYQSEDEFEKNIINVANECNFIIETGDYLDVDGDDDNVNVVVDFEDSKDEQYLEVQSVKKRSNVRKKRVNAENTATTKQFKRQIEKKMSKEELSFICPDCGNVYNERSKLTLHMKIHSKVKAHACELCGKTFAQTPQLTRHMNSHTGNRPYKCKYCDSSFSDPSTCIKHQRIHTNERPYKCDICGKSFGYSNVLKVHMQTHTGVKPFECDICGKKFFQAHHKRAHERTHRCLVSDSNEN